VKPPSTVFAVMVAIPVARLVTCPEEDTRATAVLLEDQVTFVFVAFAGAME